MVFLAGELTAFGVDDKVLGLQEFVGNLYGGLQIAATVVLQVEDKVAHALGTQLADGGHKLLISGGAEAADADVAHLRPNHVVAVDGLHRNLVAGDVEGELILDAASDDGELHLGALGSAQPPHDFLTRHFHARYGRIVDGDDTVTGKDACTL